MRAVRVHHAQRVHRTAVGHVADFGERLQVVQHLFAIQHLLAAQHVVQQEVRRRCRALGQDGVGHTAGRVVLDHRGQPVDVVLDHARDRWNVELTRNDWRRRRVGLDHAGGHHGESLAEAVDVPVERRLHGGWK